MTEQLHSNRRSIRIWYYGIIAAGFLSALMAFIANQINSRGLALSALVVVALTIALEGLIAYAGHRQIRELFAGSQPDLYQRIGGVERKLLGASKGIDILCDTMKSFADNNNNLQAIKTKIDEGIRVRVLLLHPEKEGARAVLRARTAIRELPVDQLSREIKESLGRLSHTCGIEFTANGVSLVKGGSGTKGISVRLYSEYPTDAIYRIDDEYLVTSYSFGRGGSSPAFYIRRSQEHNAFCKSLDRAFEDLWGAKTTELWSPDLFHVERKSSPPLNLTPSLVQPEV
jgi:hypothetical protein